MGSTDHGTQDLSYNFYEELSAENFNKRNMDIRPRGIYKGGYLTKVSNAAITLSPLTVEIGDADIQVSINTELSVTLNAASLDSGTISSLTPVLILRWAYVANASNYMEIHAIASAAAALSQDIIIGKCNFSGVTLTGFDYSDRTFLNVQNLFLKVEIDDNGGVRTVRLRAGKIHTSTECILVPSQLITLDNPAANSRIDLIYLTVNGVVSVVKGSEAAVPTVPLYVGRLVLAEVKVVYDDIAIPASQIEDARSFVTPVINVDDTTIEKNGTTGKLQIKAGSIESSQLGSIFGTWVTKADNVSYLAATDGFVCAYSPSALLATQRLRGYTDANNPPTTKKLDVETGAVFQTSPTLAFTMPVRKGDYWKVTGATAISWLPMGS